MSYPQLSTATPSAAEGVLTRVLGALMSLMLAALGLVFAFCLLVWLLVMAVVSLVSSWLTGRPSTVALLWRRYRDMTRQVSRPRWAAARRTPPPANDDDAVQDVRWRDVDGPAR